MLKEISVINLLVLLSLILTAFFIGFNRGGGIIEPLLIKDFMMPSVVLLSTLIAAFMAIKTLNNSKRSEVLKNTLDAIDNKLFKGEKRVKLELACTLLTQKVDREESFKALVRLRTTATRFVN